jgi:hypothetical protein
MSKCLLTLSVITLLALPTVGNAQTTLYHAPRTPAEIALSKVINLEISSGLGGPESALETGKGPYATLFTPNLVRVVASAERAANPPGCQGVCDLDVVVIFGCAQDTPPAPLYRTISATGSNEALIGYDGGFDDEINTDYGRYRMVKIGGAWKIDGIECSADGKFDASAAKFNMR